MEVVLYSVLLMGKCARLPEDLPEKSHKLWIKVNRCWVRRDPTSTEGRTLKKHIALISLALLLLVGSTGCGKYLTAPDDGAVIGDTWLKVHDVWARPYIVWVEDDWGQQVGPSYRINPYGPPASFAINRQNRWWLFAEPLEGGDVRNLSVLPSWDSPEVIHVNAGDQLSVVNCPDCGTGFR